MVKLERPAGQLKSEPKVERSSPAVQLPDEVLLLRLDLRTLHVITNVPSCCIVRKEGGGCYCSTFMPQAAAAAGGGGGASAGRSNTRTVRAFEGTP
jgi:hypothetical protein